MIGWINLSVEAFICDSFGRDAWLKIIEQSHVACNWVSSCPYPDKVTYDLVITGAGILGVTVPQALEAYGQYFVNYVIKQGYTRLLKSLGSNIAEFLANLNNLHLHLTMGFPSMVAPAFRVEEVTSTSLLLHYHSIRPALWPIVSGVLKGASKFLFQHDVEMELVASRDAGNCDHEIFRVTFPHQESLVSWDDHGAALASEYGMSTDFFYDMFPFHIILDKECRVVQAGRVMTRLFGSTLTRGSSIADTFKLRHPYIPFEYDKMVLERTSLYLLKSLQTGLEFKGQLVPTNMPDGRAVLLFLGSPRLANLEEMELHGLFLSDIPLHDMSRDFALLAEQRQAEADLKERFEKLAVELRLANERLEQTTMWLAEERQRSDALLYRMLPADIAADLREGRRVDAISYPEVSILFSDMVGFTNTSAKSSPEEVYNMLNEMYDKFDGLVDDFPDIYKLETIGDAYFLVCNLTTECHNHVDVVIDFAIRMQERTRHVKNAQGEPIQIRIGIHTGPVVGGVLGAKTPRFSIYGDTVNVASRMESHGLPGKIHISDAAYNRIVDKDKYAVRERGNISVKGRGTMTTYLIGGTNDDWLLRHTSFDAQIDGGVGAGGRDGSFVITASCRSQDNMSSNRPSFMEAINEGDEEHPSCPAPRTDSTAAANSTGGGSSAVPYSGPGGTLGGLTIGASSLASGASPASSSVIPALGLVSGIRGSEAGGSTSQVTAVAPVSGGAGGSASHSTEPLKPPSVGGGGEGQLAAAAAAAACPFAVPSFGGSGSGSFREGGPPLLRENSLPSGPPPAVNRDTSFRTVYARSARPLAAAAAAAAAAASGGSSRAMMPVNSGLLAAGNSIATASDSDSNAGIPSGALAHIRAAGGSSHQGFYEPSLLARPEPSGGSGGALGLLQPSGVVKARSATAKASPLAPHSGVQVASAAPSFVAQEMGPAGGVAGAAGSGFGGSGLPKQSAVLQQLPVVAQPASVSKRSASASGAQSLQPAAAAAASAAAARPSEMGASVASTGDVGRGPGKAKGLASKLKSLFKK